MMLTFYLIKAVIYCLFVRNSSIVSFNIFIFHPYFKYIFDISRVVYFYLHIIFLHFGSSIFFLFLEEETIRHAYTQEISRNTILPPYSSHANNFMIPQTTSLLIVYYTDSIKHNSIF